MIKNCIFTYMFRCYRYRIYPSEYQKVLINKHINCVRFIYNIALETKQQAYSSLKYNVSRRELQSQLVELKKDCAWLQEVNSQSLVVALFNLDIAYSNFFKGKGFPNFKKKSEYGCFNVPQNVSIKNGKLVIPKFKEGINAILHRQINGKIKQATISKTATGKYFVSILCELGELVNQKVSIKESTTTGIDLGIKTFIVSSDGKEYENPKFLRKAQGRLRFIQCKYSKHKGKKTKQKLAALHERVTNQRKDFLHKVSSELIKSHDSLAIETLRVSNMLKNHKLAQSVSDAGWGMFVTMLEHKAEWYGKNILKIGTFEPSSKTCSCCGKINKDLTLKDREWTCEGCKTTHDRDLNAAINIKSFALKNYLCTEHTLKNQKELPTLVGVMTSEAHFE